MLHNTIFTHSKKKSVNYFYNIQKKICCIAHPFLYNAYLADRSKQTIKQFESNSISENNAKYYLKKYAFLKSKHFFKTFQYSKQVDSSVSEYEIENQLINLKNIVFEVTDACNLRCKYCGYGELYCDYDERKDKYLSIETVKEILIYIKPYISKSNGILTIGFYGGEPLLNIRLIKETVLFVKENNMNRKIKFNMTTNAVLLDKYIDFLYQNNFTLLVSIDGNEKNHSYRVFQSGENSFNKVYQNLLLVKEKYPSYFETNVSFNTVLHNRNSIDESHSFLYNTFKKNTQLSPLNNIGIKAEKIDQFQTLYYDLSKNLNIVENRKQLIEERFTGDPMVLSVATFINSRIKNASYNKYEELLASEASKKFGLTGTCLPFQRKIFITVNGKILPCERIGQEFSIGSITNNGIDLNLKEIANTYSHFFSKIKKQCTLCYHLESCLQCIFQIKDFKTRCVCHGFVNEETFSNELSSVFNFLESHSHLFQKIYVKLF